MRSSYLLLRLCPQLAMTRGQRAMACRRRATGRRPRAVPRRPPVWTALTLARVLLTGLVATAGPAAPARAGITFTFEVVDKRARLGEYSHLVLDAQGQPHISYYNRSSGYLRYAHMVNGTWVKETVPDNTGHNVGGYTWLVLDKDEAPHIAYFDWTTFDLRYATKAGGTWRTQLVDADGHVGRYPSLQIDPQGDEHIVYYDVDRGDVKYARLSGGAWAISLVDTTGNVGAKSQMRLNSKGMPCVSYSDETNGDLKYAELTDTGWAIDVADDGGGLDVGGYTALALDAQDHPHILYAHSDGMQGLGDTWYITRTPQGWVKEVVDDGPNETGFHPSIEVDAQGNVQCVYRDQSALILKYASKVDGAWQILVVDDTGDLGYGASLAVDAQGQPHVSYYDNTLQALKYASGLRQVPAAVKSMGALRALFSPALPPPAPPRTDPPPHGPR
jgi:hypothetical protein